MYTISIIRRIFIVSFANQYHTVSDIKQRTYRESLWRANGQLWRMCWQFDSPAGILYFYHVHNIVIYTTDINRPFYNIVKIAQKLTGSISNAISTAKLRIRCRINIISLPHNAVFLPPDPNPTARRAAHKICRLVWNVLRFILNRLRVEHECDRRTDGQPECPLALAPSNIVRRAWKVNYQVNS